MKSFPLFYRLNNKHCLIIGGGKVALRRAEALSKAGVSIDVVSPDIDKGLLAVVTNSKGSYYKRLFDDYINDQSLENKNYFAILAATNNNKVNRKVYHYAKENNIVVNVASDHSLCDFIFPAIVEREPITVAVSNNGLSPVLSRLLKEQIETVIPENYGHLASLIGKNRERIKKLIPDTKDRVAFLEAAATGAIAEAVFAGKVDVAEDMLEAQLAPYKDSESIKGIQKDSITHSIEPDFAYTQEEKSAIYKVIAERRDMRHFNGKPIDQTIFKRILSAAHMAPSVGLMQPWRFIRISDKNIKEGVFQIVNKEKALTADALDTRKQEFLKLKVEGILQCAELVVAALPNHREQHIFGRRTLPEMDLASLSCAIQNMWLAARAEGIGMGWVSLFDPKALMKLLNMPEGSWPIAILCIGHVDEFYEKPMLVMENWSEEKPLEDMIFENTWQET